MKKITALEGHGTGWLTGLRDKVRTVLQPPPLVYNTYPVYPGRIRSDSEDEDEG